MTTVEQTDTNLALGTLEPAIRRLEKPKVYLWSEAKVNMSDVENGVASPATELERAIEAQLIPILQRIHPGASIPLLPVLEAVAKTQPQVLENSGLVSSEPTAEGPLNSMASFSEFLMTTMGARVFSYTLEDVSDQPTLRRMVTVGEPRLAFRHPSAVMAADLKVSHLFAEMIGKLRADNAFAAVANQVPNRREALIATLLRVKAESLEDPVGQRVRTFQLLFGEETVVKAVQREIDALSLLTGGANGSKKESGYDAETAIQGLLDDTSEVTMVGGGVSFASLPSGSTGTVSSQQETSGSAAPPVKMSVKELMDMQRSKDMWEKHAQEPTESGNASLPEASW